MFLRVHAPVNRQLIRRVSVQAHNSLGSVPPISRLECQEQVCCPQTNAELTRQLEETDLQLVPTAGQHERKSWIVGSLAPLLHRHTGGQLHTFGSCENGFWMNGSDVDACLVVRHCSQRQSWVTKLRLVESLVRREEIGTAQLVRAARVPVAKVLDKEGIELCDISVNNVAALENSKFVGALSQLDPRARILGRFIKHWASRRRINNRSEGTLSTYTLILQLFYFLQTRNPPVLPVLVNLLSEPLQELLAGPDDSADAVTAVNALATGPEMDVASGELRSPPFLTDATAICEGRFPEAGKNSASVGELLYGFFQFWGDEVFAGGEGSGQTVLVYDGTRSKNDLGVLVMRCPLTGKNVNPFTASVWQGIHAEFARAARLLANSEKVCLEELCEAALEPPAAAHGPRTR